jgi:hypothetical protein
MKTRRSTMDKMLALLDAKRRAVFCSSWHMLSIEADILDLSYTMRARVLIHAWKELGIA